MPHPGKEVEQHLGESELGLFLRDDDVASKGRLEAAAEASPWTREMVVMGRWKPTACA